MMFRIKGYVLSIMGVLFFLSSPLIPNTGSVSLVYAHVLKADGSIGIILHIDPGDDPIANSPSTLFFDVKDKTNKFSFDKCGCRVDILENGKTIYSDSFSQVITYTFPERGVYQVQAIGTPQKSGDFQPFNITYDVRVDKDAGSQTGSGQSSNWFSSHIYILAGLAALAIILGLSLVKKPKKE